MRIQPTGLTTDPSRLLAGEGGLIEAQNVVFRSAGLVEPRAAMEMVPNEDAFDALFIKPLHSREWDSATVSAMYGESDTDQIRIVRDSETAPLITLTGSYEGPRVRVYSELADGRCLWTLPNGLRCLDQSDQTPIESTQPGQGAFARMPGAPRVAISYVTYVPNATGFLASGETTAYRVTLVRWIITETGARIPVEGPPSDRYVLLNSGGGPADADLRIILYGDVREGDEVRFYRTPTNGVGGGDPGDEMILRYSWVKDDDLALGSYFVDFHDAAPSTEFMGPSLYTNASIEGGTRANYRMRTARDLATYQNKMFYAGGDAGWRQSTTIKHIGEITNPDKSETLVSVRTATATADWIEDDFTITGVPANVFAYLRVGQVVTDGAAPITGGSLYGKIVSWDAFAFTITLDTAAASTVSNSHIYVWDWLAWADGTLEYRVYAPWVVIGSTVMNAPRTNGNSVDTEAVMPVVIGGASVMSGSTEVAFKDTYYLETVYTNGPKPVMYSQTGADPNIGTTVTIEYDASFGNTTTAADPDEMSFFDLPRIAITSTKPRAFTTPIFLTYAESTTGGANRNPVATLYWSKLNQPESVPLGNYAIVGDASQPISRIFATTDRLWILKPDGIYCAYGAGDTEDSITIQLVDGTFRMIDVASDTADGARCSTWAAKCKDTVFAWTRNGIVAINSGGVTRVDGAIETDIRAITPSYTSTQVEATLGTPFCTASERESLVMFGTSGLSGESSLPGFCYVLFMETGAWATWVAPYDQESNYPLPYQCGGYGASVSGLFRVPCSAGYMRYLDVPANNTARLAATSFADDTYPVTGDRNATFPGMGIEIGGATGGVITWDFGQLPTVGSRISDADAHEYIITTLVQNGPTWESEYIDLNGEATDPVAGPIDWIHYAVPRVITYSANQPPFTEKHFKGCYGHFQLIRAGSGFDVDWRARQFQAGLAPTKTVTYDGTYLTDPDAFPATLTHDLEFDQAIMVPTETGRCNGVEVTLTLPQADMYFAMDGLTLTWDAETETIGRRR
jgi:hypothetical protein